MQWALMSARNFAATAVLLEEISVEVGGMSNKMSGKNISTLSLQY